MHHSDTSVDDFHTARPAHTLIINASAQGPQSVSAILANSFSKTHQAQGGTVDWRDLSASPPPPLGADFVAGAFTHPEKRSPAMHHALAYSDHEIAALKAANLLVIAAPMYNFGVPALLKAWFDQIIRPGKTFVSTNESDNPYRGLVAVSDCLLITVRGSDVFAPAGPMAHWNFLDPHLKAMLTLIGIEAPHHIDCSGIDDHPEKRTALIDQAENAVTEWTNSITLSALA